MRRSDGSSLVSLMACFRLIVDSLNKWHVAASRMGSFGQGTKPHAEEDLVPFCMHLRFAGTCLIACPRWVRGTQRARSAKASRPEDVELILAARAATADPQ